MPKPRRSRTIDRFKFGRGGQIESVNREPFVDCDCGGAYGSVLSASWEDVPIMIHEFGRVVCNLVGNNSRV